MNELAVFGVALALFVLVLAFIALITGGRK